MIHHKRYSVHAEVLIFTLFPSLYCPHLQKFAFNETSMFFRFAFMDTLGTLYNVDELNLEVPPELHIHEYI